MRILSVYKDSWLLIIWAHNPELCILLAVSLLLLSGSVKTCWPSPREGEVGGVTEPSHSEMKVGVEGRGAGEMFRLLTTMRLLGSI